MLLAPSETISTNQNSKECLRINTPVAKKVCKPKFRWGWLKVVLENGQDQN